MQLSFAKVLRVNFDPEFLIRFFFPVISFDLIFAARFL